MMHTKVSNLIFVFQLSTPQEESAGSHLGDSLYSILEKEAETADHGDTEHAQTEQAGEETVPGVLEFHDNKGRNVSLCHGNTMARRSDSYNQGLVISAKPLARDTLFKVRASLSRKWDNIWRKLSLTFIDFKL